MFALLESHATGMPVFDAQSDFRRARRAHAAARAARWFRRRRRPCRPRTLHASALPAGPARRQVIALRSIVGTVEPTALFDARFRPTSEHARSRWQRIALAHRKAIPLPPISVLQGDDGFYVVDGRHRVSVALALGHRDIDAWVTRARNVRGIDRRPAGRRRT